MTRVAVAGAGVHGSEIAAVLTARGGDAVRYDDEAPGFPPLSDIVDPWIAGAVWPEVRRRIAVRIFVDPYDHGIWVFPGAVVSPLAVIGRHAHIGYSAIVAHGCTVGDFATLAAGANLSGEVQVGPDAFIGAGAVVIHGGIHIGAGAFVGAGSVVVNDVPPRCVVAGNPARRIADGWNHADMASGRRGRLPSASTEPATR